MPTEKKVVQTTPDKSPRKQKPRETFHVYRPHPEYKALLQAFDGANWIVIEPVGSQILGLPRVSRSVAEIARALLRMDKSVRIIPSGTIPAVGIVDGSIERCVDPMANDAPSASLAHKSRVGVD